MTTLLLGTVLAVGAGIAPAWAHSEDGIMEIVSVESSGPLEVRIEVGIVYANDDDPAPDAAVTVTATGTDGASVGPIDVPNVNDGLYETTFEVPRAGTWSVAATSTGPAAAATGSVEVTADAPTSAPTTGATTATSAGSTTAPTDDPTTTAAPSSGATTPATASTGAGEEGEDDEDGNVLPIVLLAVLAIAAIAAVVVIARRGGRGPDEAESPASADAEPGGVGPGDTDGSTR